MGQKETSKIVVFGCAYHFKCQNGMVLSVYGKRTQHREENGGHHGPGRRLLRSLHVSDDGRSEEYELSKLSCWSKQTKKIEIIDLFRLF
jgi:hypothetical protein